MGEEVAEGTRRWFATIEKRGRQWRVRLYDEVYSRGRWNVNPGVPERMGWTRHSEHRAERLASRLIDRRMKRERQNSPPRRFGDPMLHAEDDLDAYMRESARRDPAFATAYFNAQARAAVCGLLTLIDGMNAVDWQKIPNGTDNAWLKRARLIERDASPESVLAARDEQGMG